MVGLVLLAALQRRRRGIHIGSMLRPEEVPISVTLAEIRAARNTSLDLSLNQLEARFLGPRKALRTTEKSTRDSSYSVQVLSRYF